MQNIHKQDLRAPGLRQGMTAPKGVHGPAMSPDGNRATVSAARADGEEPSPESRRPTAKRDARFSRPATCPAVRRHPADRPWCSEPLTCQLLSGPGSHGRAPCSPAASSVPGDLWSRKMAQTHKVAEAASRLDRSPQCLLGNVALVPTAGPEEQAAVRAAARGRGLRVGRCGNHPGSEGACGLRGSPGE